MLNHIFLLLTTVVLVGQLNIVFYTHFILIESRKQRFFLVFASIIHIIFVIVLGSLLGHLVDGYLVIADGYFAILLGFTIVAAIYSIIKST